MKYLGEAEYRHGSTAPMGILLVNLGTPDAPTAVALRRYLAEFLWDPRVVEMPRSLWWIVLHAIILRVRPARSARLYQKVWQAEGSPLLVISQKQCDALERRMKQQFENKVNIVLAMRYGNPSISAGMRELQKAGVRRLLVVPLYPQYSATTTASTFDAVVDVLKRWRWLPEVRFINGYCDDAAYINALVTRIKHHWTMQERAKILLFSYHGLPERYHLQGDPYHCQCHKTARLVAEALVLEDNQWRVSFQSRFGREEWLKPYTDGLLKKLPEEDLKSVDVVCPGFAADCLETLEEIAGQNQQLFLRAGGERFSYISALNDMPEHIDALSKLILRHMQGWPEASSEWDQARIDEAGAKSRHRALALGAKQ